MCFFVCVLGHKSWAIASTGGKLHSIFDLEWSGHFLFGWDPKAIAVVGDRAVFFGVCKGRGHQIRSRGWPGKAGSNTSRAIAGLIVAKCIIRR